MPVVHRYDPPERFVAGTVGPPGQRTFFLQAREGTRITSVALEKQQVAVLAERIDALLDEVMRVEGGAGAVPAVTPAGMEDTAPLDLPIEEEFRAGTMTLAWDPERDHVVIEVFALDDSDAATAAAEATEAARDVPEDVVLEEELVAEEMLVVTLSAAAARAFCQRAEAVVAAGRPPCQFCGQPLDPEGHLCPRANGFRRR
jgi:uncharacterized repeat protein (TIGR03847 family)